jgi:hypothetical protein
MMLPMTRFPPPALCRALIFCAATLAAASCIWHLAAAARAKQETATSSAFAATRELETRLEGARAAEAERSALTRRLAALAALARDAVPADAWERLARRLDDDPRIAGLLLHAQSRPAAIPGPAGLPGLDIQRLQIDAGLLHEEALLTLDAIVADTHARIAPVGCALHREAGAAATSLQARCAFDWVALVLPEEASQR